jgi:hypothetical protein
MKRDIKFRCSAIGKLMTEPKTLKEGPLSVGAKTHVREQVAQELFGVDFEIGGKQLEKGIEVEPEGLALLNRVLGLNLTKNTERREDDYITGECDLYHALAAAGYDIKCPWSVSSFPITEIDCVDKLYEWQARGYMRLWNAQRWTVAYALVDTPERLIGYEPVSMHVVSHIPEHMRLTTWTIARDAEKEAALVEKVKHARAYFREVIAEFDRTHRIEGAAPAAAPVAALLKPTAPAELPASIFN